MMIQSSFPANQSLFVGGMMLSSALQAGFTITAGAYDAANARVELSMTHPTKENVSSLYIHDRGIIEHSGTKWAFADQGDAATFLFGLDRGVSFLPA